MNEMPFSDLKIQDNVRDKSVLTFKQFFDKIIFFFRIDLKNVST